ncbi:hypothetical protein PV08_02612 [Exophiala spinifera]|uniref:carnosine N-methyltransferase n=1 Tax=Exophiala spinifera TaxID=91928 RepID=A0A0D2C3V7_9EURO|nr:uncharacterized protein PV08_02612 [Exophiala spinifera]KIW18324.1 hypothetical protein PV08_02612 [Exophiala spinifera]
MSPNDGENIANDGDEPSLSKPLFEDIGPLSDPLERQAIFAALDSYYQYRKNTHYNTTHRRRQNLYALPSSQWQLLSKPPISLLDTLSAIDDAIDYNADLADAILDLGLSSFGLDEQQRQQSNDPALTWRGAAKPNDLSKAHSTIRQFYRDWSYEGFTLEVKPLLDTVLSDLQANLPLNPTSTTTTPAAPPPPELLLPGAGLGRLLFELCRAGYNATGNEISYHQLLASNFILNCTTHEDQYAIYPSATTFTNVTSRRNQLRRHTIPDVHPATAIQARLDHGLPVGEMNMAAGDFILSYSTAECRHAFDGVVSVFFIDTAPNLIRYIETVRNCLRPGGVWINIGPLLWHFDDRVHGGDKNSNDKSNGDDDDDNDDDVDRNNETDANTHPHSHSHDAQRHHSPPHGRPHPHPHQRTHPAEIEDKGIAEPGSFELCDEEVIQLLSQCGFEILRHEILGGDEDENAIDPASTTASRAPFGFGLGYMQDPSSLLQNRYRCSHWVARRKA